MYIYTYPAGKQAPVPSRRGGPVLLIHPLSLSLSRSLSLSLGKPPTAIGSGPQAACARLGALALGHGALVTWTVVRPVMRPSPSRLLSLSSPPSLPALSPPPLPLSLLPALSSLLPALLASRLPLPLSLSSQPSALRSQPSQVSAP